MFKKILVLGLLVTSYQLLVTECHAQRESLTIATYYPSPYGSYNQLQTNSLGVGDNNNSGSLDSGDVPTTVGDVWIKGNVGIGTTNLGSRLTVGDGTTSEQAIHINAGTNPIIRFQRGGTNYWGILENYPDSEKLSIYDYGATGGVGTRLTIDDSGNVGIGTAGPVSKLHVKDGAIYVDGNYAGSNQVVFRNTDTTYYSGGHQWEIYPTGGATGRLDFFDRTASRTTLALGNDGNVGIGTTNPSSQHRLHVNGRFRAEGTEIYDNEINRTSDAINKNLYFGHRNTDSVHTTALLVVDGGVSGIGNKNCYWSGDGKSHTCPAGYYVSGYDCTGNCGTDKMRVMCCRF